MWTKESNGYNHSDWHLTLGNEEAMVEQDAGRCSWLALEKHAAHAAKGGTHLLRSPGRSLLQSPLENLAQILDTEARISAGVKEGTENNTGPDRTSPNINPQPQAPDTCTYTTEKTSREHGIWKRERERLKSEKYKHFRLPFGQNSLWFMIEYSHSAKLHS